MMNYEINKNIFNVFPELKSERLLYRKFFPEDAKDLFLIRSNDDVMRFMDSYTLKDIRETKNFIISTFESYHEQKGINWAIIEKKSGSLIGYFGFWRIIHEHCRAEIGYALHPNYWGRGFMTETLKTILKFGFSTAKFHSIEANVNPMNERSITLLEKIGFKKEAYFRENFLFNNQFLDSVIYSLLENDFIE